MGPTIGPRTARHSRQGRACLVLVGMTDIVVSVKEVITILMVLKEVQRLAYLSFVGIH